MLRSVTAFVIFLIASRALSQVPADGFIRGCLTDLDYKLNHWKVNTHHSLQPAAAGLDSDWLVLADSSYTSHAYRSRFRIRPVADLSAGAAVAPDSRPLAFGRAGFLADWYHEDRWSASLGYALDGGLLPGYVRTFADSLRVIPGSGYATVSGDLLMAHIPVGHIGYRAGKYVHLQLGRGTHFWGDGRRSLILSDVASPYPYFRVDTRIWKIKYTNLWTRLSDIHGGRTFSERRGKYTAMHALSWNVTRDFNLTFFEMVIWQDSDSMSTRNLDLHYLNPVLFFRPVEYAQGSADNVILGLGFRIKARTNLQVYGQIVLDEFLFREIRNREGWWANKFGGQIGIKWFDAFTPGLHFQLEANAVRPFTYTHGSPVQAWGHLNQPLAHPLGANFFEFLLASRYAMGEWNLTAQATWGNFGRDEPGLNQGGDIFQSYRNPADIYGNSLNQGVRHVLHFTEVGLTRSIPGTAWEGFISHVLRYEEGGHQIHRDHLVCVGVRTSGFLRNRLDF
ncbi:MAG: hypothetical protein ACK5XV_05265 [Flavobacteriales bacterium]|jgi:hypothetical protein